MLKHRYNHCDISTFERAIDVQKRILNAEKNGIYPPNITNHLLTLLEWEIDKNGTLFDTPRTLEKIRGIFSAINKLHNLGYLTSEDINDFCPKDLVEGLDSSSHIVGFFYIERLMQRITYKLKQVIQDSTKLDDTARYALLDYSNLLTSRSIYSPAEQLKILVRLLTELGSQEISSANVSSILSSDQRIKAYMEGGLPAAQAL